MDRLSCSRCSANAGQTLVAKTLAAAYGAAFPSLNRVSIWSRRPEQAISLAKGLQSLPANVEPVHNLPEAIGSADIISTATMAQTPILRGEYVSPGTHVDLVGAFTMDMREADDTLMAAGRIYVDFMDTVMDRIGEIILPIAAGVIERTHILGDLYDLVATGRSSRTNDAEITVFKNGGGAHLDLMIADYVVKTAKCA